jgi:hypothetical protein
MILRVIPLVILGLLSGCCGWGNSSHQCVNKFKPPLNCLGSAYDGASSGCYRPPGPFWCCLPGPCATCRDPWLRYYEEEHANCIGRHVCNVDRLTQDAIDEEDEYMVSESRVTPPRVIHQAKSED